MNNYPHLRLMSLMISLTWLTLPGMASAGGDADDFLANPPRVVYIGTNDDPMEYAEAIERLDIPFAALNLDAQRNLEMRLAEDLPTDRDAASALIQQRFEALDTDVRSVFHALVLTARWDIRKTPAFVFDRGAAVIYGVTDARVAVSAWRRWQRRGGGTP